MNKLINILKLLIFVSYCWQSITGHNVYEYISSDKNLSKFREQLDRDQIIKTFIQHRSVTVFAPTNTALTRFEAKNLREDVLVKSVANHVLPFLIKTESFPRSVRSLLSEAAPLYLTFKNRSVGQHQYFKDFYVNNAHIVEQILLNTTGGHKQLLYVIDETLEPYIPSTPIAPNALELISEPSIYDISERWDDYYNRIIDTKLEFLFESRGNHTFFVPISHFQTQHFDTHVVLAHVVPKQVLFLNAMHDKPYPSAANNMSVIVELSLINGTLRTDSETTYYIQSNTIRSDARHRKGVVLSRLLRANIPVKNGVIHLIDRPLMIIESSINQIIQQESDGRLKMFNKLLDLMPDIRSKLNRLQEVTILAPTDTAFNALNISVDNNITDYLGNNMNELRNLFKLHMIANHTINVYDMNVSRELMSSNNRSIKFRVVGQQPDTRLTVEGGGVNATVVEADIGATNGIIHMIDRVLGQPFDNMNDILKRDPSLSFSFNFGQQSRWNEDMTLKDRRFTYFVPSNEAWSRLSSEDPLTYKLMTNHSFATNILNRHLVENEQIFSTQLNTSFDAINARNGRLKVVSKCSGKLFIEWEGTRARIVRSDIQAMNGVIHVIDRVLMKTTNIQINSSHHPLINVTLLIISIFIVKHF